MVIQAKAVYNSLSFRVLIHGLRTDSTAPELTLICKVGLKTLLQQGIPKPAFVMI